VPGMGAVRLVVGGDWGLETDDTLQTFRDRAWKKVIMTDDDTKDIEVLSIRRHESGNGNNI
jgi:hypothetical protein